MTLTLEGASTLTLEGASVYKMAAPVACLSKIVFTRLSIKTRQIARRSNLHSACSLWAAHDAQFEAAKTRLNTFTKDPGNEAKLQLYALFKQVTVGQCNTPKPGMMDFVGKAKWDAWNKLGAISQDDAQLQYIDLVEKLGGQEPSPAESQPSEAAAGDDKSTVIGTYEMIKVTKENGICTVMLNRPEKMNAINMQMYEEWRDALNAAAADDEVSVAVVTGAGKYFSSGNDLSAFLGAADFDMSTMAERAAEAMIKFVSAFINFPKPLVALVNGPAVGISVSTLGLYDLVYAIETATFNMPFTALGQSAEGCSSYMYPKIMGIGKANEMIMLNKKVTAQEAYNRGLVTEVIPDDVFHEEAQKRIAYLASLPKKSLQVTKTLTRGHERETLHKVNAHEAELLIERWQSEDCANAIMAFFSRKN